jgi:hypothetical protein
MAWIFWHAICNEYGDGEIHPVATTTTAIKGPRKTERHSPPGMANQKPDRPDGVQGKKQKKP